MKTTSLKTHEVDKKWIVIDAEGLVVGRLASIVAMRLPRQEQGRLHASRRLRRQRDRYHAEKVKFTGRKYNQKSYFYHTGLPGRHQGAHGQVLPRRALPGARRGEGRRAHAPRGPLFRQILGNLRVYKGRPSIRMRPSSR